MIDNEKAKEKMLNWSSDISFFVICTHMNSKFPIHLSDFKFNIYFFC